MRCFQGCGAQQARVAAARECLAIVCLIVAPLGCSQNRFSQTHYVGVVDPATQILQFYRFDLVGDPGWTQTKFVSAWYDAAAIESLVGELGMSILADRDGNRTSSTGAQAHPDKATATREAKADGCADSERYCITGPEGGSIPCKDKRLAIIMTSNPDAITKAIAELATFGRLASVLKPVSDDGRTPNKRHLKILKEILERAPKDAVSKRAEDLVDALLAAQETDPNEEGGSK